MTTAQVVETSATVINSPIQDYTHLDDHTQPTYILYLIYNFLLICLRSRLNVIGTSLLENRQSLS